MCQPMREATVSLKSTMAASLEVSVAASINHIRAEESILLNERARLKVFLERKDIFALLLTDFGKSLCLAIAPLVVALFLC